MLDPEIKKEIKDAVKETVNGKLDSLCAEVKGYRKEHAEHMAEIKPILDGLKTVSVLRRGIIWTTTLIAAIGGAYLIIRKIF